MVATVLKLSKENKSVSKMSPKLLWLGLKYKYTADLLGIGGCNRYTSVLVRKVCICIRVWYPSGKQKDFDQVMLFMLMRMMQLCRKRQACDKCSKLYVLFNAPNNATRRLERVLTGDKNLLSNLAVAESK